MCHPCITRVSLAPTRATPRLGTSSPYCCCCCCRHRHRRLPYDVVYRSYVLLLSLTTIMFVCGKSFSPVSPFKIGRAHV